MLSLFANLYYFRHFIEMNTIISVSFSSKNITIHDLMLIALTSEGMLPTCAMKANMAQLPLF